MKSPFATWKSVVLTAVLAVVFYLLGYSWISRRQTGNGPWQADFSTNAAGIPEVRLSHPARGISNVTVQFTDEKLAPSNTTGHVAFAKPKAKTPFCTIVYDDLMFQPGVVTLDCFGHLVEMTPNALGINGKAFPWTNGAAFSLVSSNKMSAEARKKLKGGYKN